MHIHPPYPPVGPFIARLGDRWGAETSPAGFDLIESAADSIAPGIVDYARQIQTAGETIVDAIIRARTSLAMSDAQRRMLDIQLDRAEKGLPPLVMTAGAPSQVPPIVWAIGLAVLVYALTRRG